MFTVRREFNLTIKGVTLHHLLLWSVYSAHPPQPYCASWLSACFMHGCHVSFQLHVVTPALAHLHCPDPVAFLVSWMIISLSLFLGHGFSCASIQLWLFQQKVWGLCAYRIFQFNFFIFFLHFILSIGQYKIFLSSYMGFSPMPQFICRSPGVVMVTTTPCDILHPGVVMVTTSCVTLGHHNVGL